MITLNWCQVSDNRMEATHGACTLAITKSPDWSRWPQMGYEYLVSAHEHGTALHDLGKFTDSKLARDRCAEYVNSKAGDSRG